MTAAIQRVKRIRGADAVALQSLLFLYVFCTEGILAKISVQTKNPFSTAYSGRKNCLSETMRRRQKPFA